MPFRPPDKSWRTECDNLSVVSSPVVWATSLIAGMWSRSTSAALRGLWSGSTPSGPSLSTCGQTRTLQRHTGQVSTCASNPSLTPRYEYDAAFANRYLDLWGGLWPFWTRVLPALPCFRALMCTWSAPGIWGCWWQRRSRLKAQCTVSAWQRGLSLWKPSHRLTSAGGLLLSSMSWCPVRGLGHTCIHSCNLV